MFKNLSLKTQLSAGLAAVVLGFLATLAVVAGLLLQLEAGVRRVDAQSLPLVLAVDQMDLSRSEVQQFLTDVSATHDPAAYAEADEAARRFHAAAQTVRQVLGTEATVAQLDELTALETAFKAFVASGRRMAKAYVRDGIEAGNLLMKGAPGQPGFDQVSETLSDRLTTFREATLAAARQDTQHDLQAAATIKASMLWGAALATVLAVVVGSLIVRGVLAQLGGEPREVVRLMQRVGAGDLSTAGDGPAAPAGSLMAHLQAMQHELAAVVATVRDKAQQVERASADIESGNQDLSSRTSTQASSLEETAAAMEQLNTTVAQGADGARQASELAVTASSTAEQGGELVARFVDTMQGITASSRQIAEIIGVIDGIAFQTNILALNASVEAARAGDQGRGFAVVASEVRSLAGRSAEAAKAIKGLITSSVERVDEGSQLVTRTQAKMAEVVDGIRRVSQTMNEIRTAASEQSSGVALVAEAVGRMDQLTQHNAALVEGSAHAAATLRQQAHELAAAVAVFKLA